MKRRRKIFFMVVMVLILSSMFVTPLSISANSMKISKVGEYFNTDFTPLNNNLDITSTRFYIGDDLAVVEARYVGYQT